MTQYAVYRIGSNAANQPMTQELLLALVTAESAANACDRVAAGDASGLDACRENYPTVYSNQRLHAKPASRCGKRELQELCEVDAIRRPFHDSALLG